MGHPYCYFFWPPRPHLHLSLHRVFAVDNSLAVSSMFRDVGEGVVGEAGFLVWDVAIHCWPCSSLRLMLSLKSIMQAAKECNPCADKFWVIREVCTCVFAALAKLAWIHVHVKYYILCSLHMST